MWTDVSKDGSGAQRVTWENASRRRVSKLVKEYWVAVKELKLSYQNGYV